MNEQHRSQTYIMLELHGIFFLSKTKPEVRRH